MTAKVIYNLIAGRENLSPTHLAEVLTQLQDAGVVPEVYMVDQDIPVEEVVADSLRRGIRLFVVCGGDGTLDRTIPALIDTPATLAIVPTGTQNNAALTFGIPLDDIPAAIDTLRRGKAVTVDTGLAEGADVRRTFLEVASLGLTSALFQPADELQHGDLTKIAELVGTLVSFPAAPMQVSINGGEQTFEVQAHTAVIANLPYSSTRLHLAEDIHCDDGLLDLFLFSDVGKTELLSFALRTGGYVLDDPRIQHLQVRSVTIRPEQPMPSMADDVALGEGELRVQVQPHSLRVIANTDFKEAKDRALDE